MSALRRAAVTMDLLQDQVLPRRIFLAPGAAGIC
jgi:hypothetical protein